MAVLVEALSVIVRRETIARRYDGAWPGFVADTLNKTMCADSDLARVGFMHPDDVRAFVDRLEQRGFVFLDATGAAVDIVVVDQQQGPTTPCGWIEFFRQEVPGGSVAAVRLANSQENNLVCPDGWELHNSLSNNFQFHPGTKPNENFDFVRHEHGNDVFRDRTTGKEFYMGRPSALQGANDTHAAADDESTAEQYQALWAEAWELLAPFFGPNRRNLSTEEIAKVAKASEALERMTSSGRASWHAWWLFGVARRCLRDREGAYAAFARAYGMAPDEIETGRNLGLECITLGYADEAISVTAAVVALAPDNAGLVANHALALLIGGDLDGALREVRRSLRLDPNDTVTLNLRRIIDNVCAGIVEAPSKIEL